MKKASFDFFVSHYLDLREDLVRYGRRFDQNADTAEDLVEDSHDAICNKYALLELTADDYIGLMKTSMMNRYRDHYQHEKLKENLQDSTKFKSAVSPKPLMPLDEHACRSEEVELLMLAMARMGAKDREILREQVSASPTKRYQAKKRLESRLIAVIANQKHPPVRPNCPYCFSSTLYFQLEALHWVCATCGQVTKVPAIDQERKKE